jgi:hypothetical protein
MPTTGAYRLETSIAGVFEPAVFALENVAAPSLRSMLYFPSSGGNAEQFPQ